MEYSIGKRVNGIVIGILYMMSGAINCGRKVITL